MNAEETTSDPFDACAHCGAPFERDVRYPVTTEVAPDGTLRLASFCDPACQAAWRDDRD